MPYSRRRTVLITLCSCLVVAAAIVAIGSSPKLPNRPPIAQCLTVAEDGRRLSSVFEGRNGLAKLPIASGTQNRCGNRLADLFRGKLSRFFEPSVLAANCPIIPCAGTKQADSFLPCPAPGCVGNFNYAHYEGNAPEDQGLRADGSAGCHAASGYTCTTGLCNTFACTVTPPCTHYPVDTCPEGQRCEGGICRDYSCPSPFPKCRHDTPECVLYGSYCGDNLCCQGRYCDDSIECELGKWCNNHSCSPYTIPCLPNEPACHLIGDCPAGFDYCSDPNQGCCKNHTPIVIDVDGDGYLMTSGNGGVFFDLAANGKPVKISWTAAGVDDGWLALDRNGNGRIDSGKELFGDVTAQPDGEGERQGFKALAVFDQKAQGGNSNGWIDPSDRVYRRLVIWQDRNHNGVSERAELARLDPLGITAISLDYQESKWVDIYGNQFRYRAKVVREGRGKGRNKWAYDVFLVRGDE